MTDYASNSNKDKGQTSKPEKKIERVAVGEVIVKKRTIGQRLKGIFIKADIRGVGAYVVNDVMIPAAQNMFVDGVIRGVERLTFGERAIRGRNYGYGPGIGSRFTYNRPVTRGFAQPAQAMGRSVPVIDTRPRELPSRSRDFVAIFATREEATSALGQMIDVIDKYDTVSVADLNEMAGLEMSPVDNKWGWIDLRDATVRQIREGWLLDLPQPEPIS